MFLKEAHLFCETLVEQCWIYLHFFYPLKQKIILFSLVLLYRVDYRDMLLFLRPLTALPFNLLLETAIALMHWKLH